MVEKFEYEPLLFRRAAVKTGSVRDQINGVIARLDAAAAGRGSCWGDDTLGQNFFKGDADNGYEASKKNTTDSAKAIAGNMGTMCDGQLESARLLEQMEKGNYEGLR
ncbi:MULTISPECIES: hypothetical protein [Nocardia]|jgi:hypothetical protein|uniref:hypothetical protein n=1 Tax=Nocardia TaxID=1817 RepID=UPI0006F92236|nr:MULTISPECIES: hypothetical protein [Nocardia]KQY33250.1 hypothetical protein ASD42_15345 [Nocardia sp. Root136]